MAIDKEMACSPVEDVEEAPTMQILSWSQSICDYPKFSFPEQPLGEFLMDANRQYKEEGQPKRLRQLYQGDDIQYDLNQGFALATLIQRQEEGYHGCQK